MPVAIKRLHKQNLLTSSALGTSADICVHAATIRVARQYVFCDACLSNGACLLAYGIMPLPNVYLCCGVSLANASSSVEATRQVELYFCRGLRYELALLLS
jgi:hypothetical protein